MLVEIILRFTFLKVKITLHIVICTIVNLGNKSYQDSARFIATLSGQTKALYKYSDHLHYKWRGSREWHTIFRVQY